MDKLFMVAMLIASVGAVVFVLISLFLPDKDKAVRSYKEKF